MEELLLREEGTPERAGQFGSTPSSSSSRGSSSSRDTVLSCRGGEDSYVAGSWHPDYLAESSETESEPNRTPPLMTGMRMLQNFF
jgi:hypothetical protein